MSSPSAFERLPAELLIAVLSHLSNQDIKNVRLTNKAVEKRALLRLSRVFISANPLNIQVFRAIADHDHFRHQVTEIIWDDVLLSRSTTGSGEEDEDDKYDSKDDGEDYDSDPDGAYPPPQRGVPYWFVVACRQSENSLKRKDDEGLVVLDTELPIAESWRVYKQLLQQQDDVLASDADVEALRYGLERFPALKRITLTAATHGVLDYPMYKTPMIRGFPVGFRYPVDCGRWPPREEEALWAPYECLPWDLETERAKWRGFSIVMRELARHIQASKICSVPEFVIDVDELETGLSCRVFDKPCEEYDNLVTILQQPGFGRLDLALLADGQYYGSDDWRREEYLQQREPEGWSSFRSGYLKRAFESVEDPYHISLRVQAEHRYCRRYLTERDFGPWLPLDSIMPVGKWKKLRHLGISGLIVDIDDLIHVLAAQPSTLRSVELSFLIFRKLTEGYYDLLEAMRGELRWKERNDIERPRVTIHRQASMVHEYTCYDNAVYDFLYQGAQNPFSPGLPHRCVGRFRAHPRFQCPGGDYWSYDPFELVRQNQQES